MKNAINFFLHGLQNRRAQILLPAVLLIPIFILVIYLLFETVKVSMTKIRQQFALDNSAYSQMSAASGYLNAVAIVNGPLQYRVMRTFSTPLVPKQTHSGGKNVTLFDIFYQAGAFPSIGPEHGDGAINNKAPRPDSNDWDLQYYKDTRKSWMKDDPSEGGDKGRYTLTDEKIADDYFFDATTIGLASIKEYLSAYIKLDGIYSPQNFIYKDVVKSSRMFREAYFLNTKDCDKNECGKESGSILEKFELTTKPFSIDKVRFYVSESTSYGSHSRSYPIDLEISKMIKSPLFQFAYLVPDSRNRLRALGNGVVLKQNYKVPINHFNINLTDKYKPYVRNAVSVQCPRASNNCVWPNPLPKYSVKLAP